MNVPQDIVEAERKVSRWFDENNIKYWELGGSRSRFYEPRKDLHGHSPSCWIHTAHAYCTCKSREVTCGG